MSGKECRISLQRLRRFIVKHQNPESKNVKIPFWRVVLSVIQASFGVQTQANRERDFKQGNWLPYVVAAVLFTAVFVLGLVFVVKLVLAS
jgi:hypothetical protein